MSAQRSCFKFRLPESFEPGDFLPLKLRCLADDARYFMSLILTKLSRREVDAQGNVRLHAAYLRNVMHKHRYRAVIEALLEGGAVTRAPYQVGARSFGYMLSDRFRRDQHVRVQATCPRLIGRLQAFHESVEAERRARMLPVHRGLERQQYRLRIDGDLAREIIRALPPGSNPFDVQGVLVRDIEQRDFHINVGRYGRLANNVSSMNRNVRRALRHGRRELQHVDIRCCQPALIGKLMSNQQRADRGQGRAGTDGDTHTSIYDAPAWASCDDWIAYCRVVQGGTFYDWLLERMPPGWTRDELKRRFLADVLAKRKANRHGAEYPSAIEDCFAKHFPTVYRFIRSINRDGWEHANLIRLLQRAESHLVIETVAADLLKRHPRLFVVTLHDAIHTTPEGIPLVVRAFERAFMESGYPMSLKVAA